MRSAAQPTYGWDHPDTARYYEEFCRRHTRYQEANQTLVESAEICRGMTILDMGAGTGRTAESALPFLGDGQVLCVEPAEAMRRAGQARLNDPRIRWAASLPDSAELFDRILWGAGIWQAVPLESTFRKLSALLNPSGILRFNLPALYLGIPDEPGGGPDPLLLQLPSLLADHVPPAPPDWTLLPDPEGIDKLLQECRLLPERSSFRIRMTQECYRDWLKIPVMTDRMMYGLDADERADRIDEVYASVAPGSWKWEGWLNWAARKAGGDV